MNSETSCPGAPTYDDHADARVAIAAALSRAGAEGKRVALVFGADWCTDTRALDAALAHRLVAPIIEPAFVVARVSVGARDRNLDLMAGYGLDVRKSGIPSVAVLEPDGTLVAATRDGELRDARSMLPVEVATLFHRWAGRPAA